MKKLKIAIVNKFFFLRGGQESLAFSEAEMLKNTGNEVAFFSMKHPSNPENYEYDKYFIDYAEFSNIGKEYSFFRKLNFAKNFIRNAQAAKNFELFIKDFKPDIIHCHGIAHQITPTILVVAKKYNIPVVQTLHDFQLVCPNYTLLTSGKTICDDLKCLNGNYLHCIKNKCVKNSLPASVLSSLELLFNFKIYSNYIDRFISPSNFLRNIIIKSGISENKILHIPNSIDVEHYSPEYKSSGYFIYVGRLSFEKGLITLLNAFEKLPEAQLKIIGTGPEQDNLIDYKEKKNLKNVEFLGFKTPAELTQYFNECEAMILPSEWYENAPMSIIEAFSYGKPVIASNLGGVPEMIQDDFSGYIFQAGSSCDLVEKINKFLNDNSLHEKLGKNAREFALKNYNKQSHFDKLLNLYHSIIK